MAAPAGDALLLCSASPRRAALLTAAGIEFELGPAPDVDETPPAGMDAGDVALALAIRKVEVASARVPDQRVLCADTTVVLDGAILDKPRDAADAADMLKRLSGRPHRVVTGVAIALRGRVVAAQDAAQVTFRALSRAEIDAYVATREPFGKAGGYAIQGGAAPFVGRLDGDVETVVGLPTRVVRELISRVGDSGGRRVDR